MSALPGPFAVFDIREIKSKMHLPAEDLMPAIAALDDIEHRIARHRTLMVCYATADGTSEVSTNIAGVTQAAANAGVVAGQAAARRREVDTFPDSVRAA